MINISIRAVICGVVLSASTISVTTVQAQPLGFAPAARPSSFEQFFRAPGRAEEPSATDTARHLKRQLVAYAIPAFRSEPRSSFCRHRETHRLRHAAAR
jgi:hypothetical protein